MSAPYVNINTDSGSSVGRSDRSWWQDRELRRGVVRRLGQVLALQVVTAALAFAAAGTLAWSRAWAYFGLTLFLVLCNTLYVLPRNPDVVVARSRVPNGTTTADKVILPIYSLFSLGIFPIAGLDAVRFGVPLSWSWSALGAGLLTAGMALTAGAMAANRHLENTVRLQEGHQVATRGPYAVIRHPMYVGLCLSLPGGALALGSAYGLIPAAAAVVMLVVRTWFEDRTLQRRLPGYSDYAARTRYRLLPGIW